MKLVKAMSFREAADTLNRVRGASAEAQTPSRTLANMVEIEGDRIQKRIEVEVDEILQHHGFSQEGQPLGDSAEQGADRDEMALSRSVVSQAIEEYNTGKEETQQIDEAQAERFYEVPHSAVNVSLDDVGVKRQKETGRSPQRERKTKREYVRNTIAHIETCEGTHILNHSSVVDMLRVIVAFLLHNGLIGRCHIGFFVDGERTLQNAILARFGWARSFSLVLDWYHLQKKCEMQLSLALKGREIRNAVLEQVLSLLWVGRLDESVLLLRALGKEKVKDGKAIDRLIGYFERNRDFIPCYAPRKRLGLRNSSNKGEKANDLAVSTRQKHNGMSWSRDGSVALATITVLQLNGKQDAWFSQRKVGLELAA